MPPNKVSVVDLALLALFFVRFLPNTECLHPLFDSAQFLVPLVIKWEERAA